MAAPAQNIPDAPQGGVLTLGELARTIKRNGWAFWTTLVVGLGVGVAASILMPAHYLAVSEILVEGPSGSGGAASPDLIVGEVTVPGSSYGVATQIEILKSQRIRFQVLERAGYEFPNDFGLLTQEQLDRMPSVSVFQQGETNVFQVLVEGSEPEIVQNAALNYAPVFSEYIQDLKERRIQRALTFVEGRIAEEQGLLEQAEADLAAFKSQNQVVDTTAELNRRVNETASTNQSYTVALQRYNEAQATVDRLEQELAETDPVLETEIERTNNETLLQNKSILASLEVQREGLLTTYRPESRQVQDLDRRIAKQKEVIADLEGSLVTTQTETNPRIEILRGQLVTARANRDAASASLNEIRSIADDRTNRLNELSALVPEQRDLELSIVRHNTTIDQLNALMTQYKTRDNEITSGVEPLRPSSPADQIRPDWTINMALAGLLSLALSVVVVLVRDSLKDKVNSIDEAYALSQLDIMTRIPQRPGGRNQLISDPQSSVAFETYRVLRSLVGFMDSEEPIKSLVLTSTNKGEGKTVVSSNLAVAYALNGQDTVLVDANLRDPGVHDLFGKPLQPGLGEVLTAQQTVDSVLIETDVDNLKIISAGETLQNSTEAVGSDRMQAIIAELTERGFIVIIDAPAILGLADAPSVASLADASIIVNQLGKSTKAEWKDAVGLLRASSPRVLGMVFNKVKVKDARLSNA